MEGNWRSDGFKSGTRERKERTDSFEAGPGIRSRFHHEPFRAHDGLPDLTLSAFIRVDLRNPWSIPTASFREANAPPNLVTNQFLSCD